MTHIGSYHVDSFATSTDAEIRRLNAQVDLFWPVESEALIRFGLRDGINVLDCGCGPGRLLELIQRRFPSSKCSGIEIDPLLVETGRQHLAASGLPHCTIQQGSAEQPGLPLANYDFIVMRLVLEHIPDPVAALRSVSSLLRPGGRLAVISNDFDFHLRTSPSVPELEQLYMAYRASRRKDGGDPCIGRRVPHLLIDSGLKLVGAEIEIIHNALVGDGPFLKAEGAGIPAQLVKSGFLDTNVLDAMTRSWRNMLNTPGHSITRPLWIAVGEKTGTPSTTHEAHNLTASPESQRHEKVNLPNQLQPSVANETQLTNTGTLEHIQTLIAEALEVKSVSPDATLAALGIDSIAAMMLQERIKHFFGVEIPVMRFFEDTTVTALANSLAGRTAAPAQLAPPLPRTPSKQEEGEI